MKVLSIGTDRKLFDTNSAVRQRIIEYGKFFKEMHIVVFSIRKPQTINLKPQLNSKIQISENIWLYPTNSKNKFFYLIDAFKISKKIINNSKFIVQDFIISCQDPFETGLVGVLIKLFYGIPLHIQIHTDLFNKYFDKFLLNKIRLVFAPFVIRYADRVRVVSERVKDSISEINKNVDVLPIKTELKIANNTINKDRKHLNLLTVCRLEKEKNLETAIKAFKIVSQKYPEAIFTIVGDGSERKNLESKVKYYGLEEKVKFVGWQDNLRDYYNNANIYISTSFYEGYGLSIVEAASFELALVLSDTGVAGHIYKNEISALICDALDATCFALNILRLFEDKNLAQKLSQKAKEETKKHLNKNENYFEKYADSVKQTNFDFTRKNIFRRIFEFKITLWKSLIYLRYFLCGITAAGFNIFLLYLFTDIFGIWYLYSSIIAFIIALILSFSLQKFVVFKDGNTNGIHKQFSMFAVVAILGVATNTLLVYLFTDILNVWYILSQIFAGVFVMVQNFLLYKIFIFNKS